jgi:hypothetical protein
MPASEFSTFLYAILKSVHHDLQQKNRTDILMNKIFNILIEKTMNTLNDMDIDVLTYKNIIQAAKKMLNGELKYYAVKNIEETIKEYKNTKRVRNIFPLNKILNIIENYGQYTKIEKSAVISFGILLEYIIGEIYELAGNLTKEKRKQSITKNKIIKAIENDVELQKIFIQVL